MSATTIHLRPTAELAPRALLPGDPGRALALAQTLLSQPRMFNHNRGLWGYTGAAADGLPLTIQSTGMGGPSAAIVLEELIMLGLQVAVRVGTCGALVPDLALGDLVVARDAIAADGTSRALGAPELVPSDGALCAALERAAAAAGRAALTGSVVSTDVFYDGDPANNARWSAAGAVAVEMEAATLFHVGRRHGIAVACVLTVSDRLLGEDGRERIDDDALAAAAAAMGTVAASAVAA